MNPSALNSFSTAFDTTDVPPTIFIVTFFNPPISASANNVLKYAFVSFGNSFALVNNIGALTDLPPNSAAKVDAYNPSTNESPFTNTIYPSPSVPSSGFFTDSNRATSLAILTAVSYLLFPANTSTCA